MTTTDLTATTSTHQRVAPPAAPARRQPPLTTAESLIVELVIAHRLLQTPYTVLSNRHWVRPQLDSLRERGLIDWSFDSEANFQIVPDPSLMGLPETRALWERLQA